MAAAADSKSAIREYVRVRVPLLAPERSDRQTTWRLEGCPSGRWCNLGKVVWGQLHRGFESPPFRQHWRLTLRTEVLGVFLLPEIPDARGLFAVSLDNLARIRHHIRRMAGMGPVVEIKRKGIP